MGSDALSSAPRVCRDHQLMRGYGVSTRTMVGFGIPAVLEYTTDPRYLVAGARPLKVSPPVPLPPVVAVLSSAPMAANGRGRRQPELMASQLLGQDWEANYVR